MAGSRESVRDLLRQAQKARSAGDLDAARAAFVRAYGAAQLVNDVAAMGEAALGLAADHSFGTDPGRVPAYLFEAYRQADGTARVRLAVALVRTWVYGGSPARAVDFAADAVRGAAAAGDPTLLADALDAQLLVHWGPDHLEDRLRITAQLEDTVAHVADAEARMSAHLWRLTTAVEGLDLPTARRQLRALTGLADETGSPRVRFFAEARQGMYATVAGDLEAANAHRLAAIAAGVEAGEADTSAIDHALAAAIARQTEDLDALCTEARGFEEFGTAEGYLAVAVEAAALWVAGGALGHARSLLLQLVGAGLAGVERDLDWLLIVSRATETAARTGELELAAEGYALLEPYAGRGIANAGAAIFDGVVDGYLSEAAAALGRPQESVRWTRRAASLAQRFGADWWVRRYSTDRVHGTDSTDSADATDRTDRTARSDRSAPLPARAVLRPAADGVWTIGQAGATFAVREMKGFHYLRVLVRQPGVDISALELSDWIAGHPGSGVTESSVGDLIDKQALAAYRARLIEIDSDLDEAIGWADEARAARLNDEREALLEQVAAATGLGHRTRRSGATAERARVAVRKAIAAAIDRISQVDAALGRLLRDCIQTGAICRYEPDPARPLAWSTDIGDGHAPRPADDEQS